MQSVLPKSTSKVARTEPPKSLSMSKSMSMSPSLGNEQCIVDARDRPVGIGCDDFDLMRAGWQWFQQDPESIYHRRKAISWGKPPLVEQGTLWDLKDEAPGLALGAVGEEVLNGLSVDCDLKRER